jgi:hypothetical protein
MCVGLADQDFPVNKHPGQTQRSVGYRSDGKVFIAKQEVLFIKIRKIDLKMPPYKTGDSVGCGINFLKREIFFTKESIISCKISTKLN